MIEVPDGEKFKPDFEVWFAVVDKFKRHCEFSTKTSGNMVEHHCSMCSSEVSEFTANLFFGDVRPSHLNNGAPGAFCQTIGRLTASWSSNDFVFFV